MAMPSVDVFMVRVRRKRASVGLTVKNQWGQGWYLNEPAWADSPPCRKRRTLQMSERGFEGKNG